MNDHSSSRHQHVIPPYMLHKIIEQGSELQRQCARQTLIHVNTLLAEPYAKPTVSPSAKAGEVRRNIYDARCTTALPGAETRQEGQASNGNISVDEAYDALGMTYDFFWQVYKRNSLDNQGLALISTVHYDEAYQNAFWNGQQMVLGDGDGEIFNRFTLAIEVIAHELSHGVTEAECSLIYCGQSGVLNESISDVFGSLVKQFHLKQMAEQADWIIGKGLLAKGIQGEGLRSMSYPGTAYDDPLLGKDPQPAHMNGYINTTADNGGVHINSGIPNRAFYLAATALGGYAWERAGYAWYDTVCDKSLPKNTDFATFAEFTVMHGKKRFDQDVAFAIHQAWEQVGVL